MPLFLFLVILFSMLGLRGLSQSTLSHAVHPEDARILTEDIDRFWRAYDLAYPWFPSDLFDSLYFKPGSAGLRYAFARQGENAIIWTREIRKDWDRYEAVRGATLSIAGQATEIRAAMYALKYLYPEAVFPDIYFIIGAGGPAIHAQGDCLIISAEQFGAPDTVITRARRPFIPSYTLNELPVLAVRELVLYQQRSKTGPLSLLGQCIREGIADLITELITGRQLRPDLHAFARPREQVLWEAFCTVKHQWSTQGWLYHGAGNRPDNLGIWIGYRIAASYYEQATDKRQAIREMLHIRDYNRFLADSGYNPEPLIGGL